ncbi:MlaD family protein [Geomonas sp.]|uniref:MlaD family protein n=1 Tax=Geomonas sp. TaxID=2651584 RepID=UPI002B475117|nr:MlaD family protein [Geomonas sp.]HJV33995.1 MlaD family protein [Geomonas sp.]
MTQTPQNDEAKRPLPKANIRRNWWTWLFWAVPIGAAALAAFFIYQEVIRKGPTITVYFQDAGNIQAGNAHLKYRGVEIGDVEKVSLTDDQKMAKLTIALKRSGESVAKEGSVFWIVQPHVGLSEIKALGTVVSGDYVAVEPGPGKERTKFVGLSAPPLPKPEKKGLRIILVSERLGSVKKHAAVMYRGVQVGEVWDAHLGPDSQVIYIEINIEQQYAPLVRMNSKFWNAGGINVNIGFSGVDISAQSAQALLTGGIDFATPDAYGKEAIADTAFRLYDKAEDAWLAWAPAIKLPPHGSAVPTQETVGD